MTTKSITHLADLGVYGFDRQEPVILAALVTEDPMLLIGRFVDVAVTEAMPNSLRGRLAEPLRRIA